MASDAVTVTCTLCGLEQDANDVVDGCRCKQCNALRVRLYRKASQTEKAHFAKLNKPTTEDFYRTNADKFKGDLSIALTTAIKDVVTVSEETGFKGAGHFMDKEDMEEKYKNKPGRAATIMKNCDQYYCENAECKMYKDLDYTSTDSTGTKRDVTSTTDMEQEEKRNLKRKPRLRKATRQTRQTRQSR